MAQTIQSNRVTNEAGKGVQALRRLTFAFDHQIAGAISPVKTATYPVDVDVIAITITAGLVPADNSTNKVNIFNGTVAGAHSIASLDISSATGVPLVAQVPVSVPVVPTYQRVKAGTPISVQAIFGASDAAASAQVAVEIDINIPIDTPYDGAKTTTYQAYDAGF